MLAVASGVAASDPAARSQGPDARGRASAVRAVPDEAAVQRELRLKRIARLRQQGRGSDAHRLLPMLKDPDAEIRRQAELAIWSVWGRSGNADVDRLFRAGVQQIGREAYDDAIEILSRVVDNKPDFAEAWNKRATARFLAGDLVGALDDVERALSLVPEHFGSLAGYGHIYFRLDDLDRAIHYWERALAINPNLDGIARSVEAARRLQVGRGRLST